MSTLEQYANTRLFFENLSPSKPVRSDPIHRVHPVECPGIPHKCGHYKPGSFARLGRPKPVQIPSDLKWLCDSTYDDPSGCELHLTTNPAGANRKISIDATTCPATTNAREERRQGHFARGETMGGKIGMSLPQLLLHLTDAVAQCGRTLEVQRIGGG